MSDLWPVLLGVLAGGAITAATTAFFEKRREQRALRSATRIALRVLVEQASVWRGGRQKPYDLPQAVAPPSPEIVAILAGGLQPSEWTLFARALELFQRTKEDDALDEAPLRWNEENPPDVVKELIDVANAIGLRVLRDEWQRLYPPPKPPPPTS